MPRVIVRQAHRAKAESSTTEEYFLRNVAISGGSRNFKTGGARSRRGRIFRSGVCFDAPSHILYVFVARVVNKIHNINTDYLLKSKYMCVIQSNFTKTNPNFFQNGGRASGAPVLDPPLAIPFCDYITSELNTRFSEIIGLEKHYFLFYQNTSFMLQTQVKW